MVGPALSKAVLEYFTMPKQSESNFSTLIHS